MTAVRDRVGVRVGRLVVLARSGSDADGATWLCRCDCGGEKTVATRFLQARTVRSCGCLMRLPRPERRRSTMERFLEKVTPEPNTGCWLWTGYLNEKRGGYGTFARGNGEWRKGGLRAHRAAWTLFRGPIPDGLAVCHRCDFPPCVNPDHLFLGTIQDNVDDMRRKGRANPTAPAHVRRGTEVPQARLNDQLVASARRRAAAGEGPRAMAADFGVDESVLGRAIRGATWAHVQDPPPVTRSPRPDRCRHHAEGKAP
jgi:hypothetical protein